jgi:hypothetical protein
MMTLKHTTFGNLYLFIKLNSQPTKAGNSFRLVDKFCANHSLDPVTLKEVFFYFGANTDEEVLAKVKGHVLGKAILRPWGYHANKMARS